MRVMSIMFHKLVFMMLDLWFSLYIIGCCGCVCVCVCVCVYIFVRVITFHYVF
jgi:hypothetical protein